MTTAYVDDAGNAKLRMSIVGFLDLLGFSHTIRTTSQRGDAQVLLDRIRAAIGDSRQYVRQELANERLTSEESSDDPGSTPVPLAVKYFSDNLVLGFPFEAGNIAPASAAWFVIRCSQHYQLRMALNGFFLRGGLTQGPVCLTDDIIFGGALLECYELESHASIVPRVILAEPLSRLVVNSFQAGTARIPADAANSLCRDIDGWWFVSYLEAARDGERIDWDAVERHKHSVLQSLAGITRHDVLPKYGWACRYHNMFCRWHRDAPGYSDRFRIEREDETSLICRLGDAAPASVT